MMSDDRYARADRENKQFVNIANSNTHIKYKKQNCHPIVHMTIMSVASQPEVRTAHVEHSHVGVWISDRKISELYNI